jgi:hypothetical protein
MSETRGWPRECGRTPRASRQIHTRARRRARARAYGSAFDRISSSEPSARKLARKSVFWNAMLAGPAPSSPVFSDGPVFSDRRGLSARGHLGGGFPALCLGFAFGFLSYRHYASRLVTLAGTAFRMCLALRACAASSSSAAPLEPAFAIDCTGSTVSPRNQLSSHRTIAAQSQPRMRESGARAGRAGVRRAVGVDVERPRRMRIRRLAPARTAEPACACALSGRRSCSATPRAAPPRPGRP